MNPIILATIAVLASSASASSIETLYIVPMSHTDIGFTAPPSTVARQMAVSVDDALEAAKQDPDYRWVFENFWQLEQWLKKHPNPSPVVRRLREGRFGLSAAYATPHSSLLSDWTLEWYFRLPAEWGRKHGLEMDWAVLNDVPGHPFNLPSRMAACGVRYLAIGSNQSLSRRLPAPISNTPFWWEGPDGQRVLTWISAESYVEGFERYGIPPEIRRGAPMNAYSDEQRLAFMREDIGKALQSLGCRSYPYDAALVLHAFDNWGSRPSRSLPAAVKLWNDTGASPRLLLSTPREFFTHIEEKYGSQLPTHRGGFGGQWEIVRMGTPTAMARARAFEDKLRAKDRPRRKRVAALLTYWEHSFGMGPGWPNLLTRDELLLHNRDQERMVKSWPLPPLDLPHGTSVELPLESAAAGLESNSLYLVTTTKCCTSYHKLDGKDWPEHSVERLNDGTLRLRHTINRLTLPPSARIIWAWRLSTSEANAPALVRTGSETTRIPEDNIFAYDSGRWIAWQEFSLGQTTFTPHGVFSFSRRTWGNRTLVADVLSQGTHCVLKGNEKAALTFEEAYPGEEPLFRFVIDVKSP